VPTNLSEILLVLSQIEIKSFGFNTAKNMVVKMVEISLISGNTFTSLMKPISTPKISPINRNMRFVVQAILKIVFRLKKSIIHRSILSFTSPQEFPTITKASLNSTTIHTIQPFQSLVYLLNRVNVKERRKIPFISGF
jgi:hypothetical protein